MAKVAGKSEGPKLTLKVMAGDTISISAQAFYNIDRTLPGQGADIVPVVGSAIAALAGGAMVPAGEAASLALDLGATASTSAALSQLPQDRQEDEETQPESGLHFVLYNEQMDVVEANTGILPVDDRINSIQDLSSDRIVIQESGYLEVFVNNEAQTPVYYDNLVVMQSTGNVIEVNAYYPYGKIIQGLSTSSTYGKNNYKYNGKELQTELELNWLDYGWRPLPTSHPVWFVPDPLAEKYYGLSPYAYCANNPILYIDPDGMDWLAREVNGNNEYFYDRDITDQDMANEKYGKGIRHIQSGTTIRGRTGNKIYYEFTLSNGDENTGQVTDMNGNIMDNTENITTKRSTIFATCDDCLDPGTLYKNLLGTSYTGKNNPLSYIGKSNYDFMPKNLSEYASMNHDQKYDKTELSGFDGILSLTTTGADLEFAIESSVLANPMINPNPVDVVRAAGQGAFFGAIGIIKLSIAVRKNSPSGLILPGGK